MSEQLATVDLAGKIRFVLVEPSHPGNIGAVARAMKTMGLGRLYLVKPKEYPSEIAVRRAAGALDVLDDTVVCESLDEALADCILVAGTSVREREVSWTVHDPASAADRMLTAAAGGEVAVVFGRERSGLDNAEMDRASMQIRIPSNPQYDSLNLASAAQLIAYEIRKALLTEEFAHGQAEQPWQLRASQEDLRGMFEHIEEALEAIEFIKYRPATKLMRKIIRLFNKAEITNEELQIIRGIMTSAIHAARGDRRWQDDETHREKAAAD